MAERFEKARRALTHLYPEEEDSTTEVHILKAKDTPGKVKGRIGKFLNDEEAIIDGLGAIMPENNFQGQ